MTMISEFFSQYSKEFYRVVPVFVLTSSIIDPFSKFCQWRNQQQIFRKATFTDSVATKSLLR